MILFITTAVKTSNPIIFVRFINNIKNGYNIALGNRIGSAARKQMSCSTVRRNRRQHQSSDSEDSDASDGENSDKGESSDYFYLVVYQMMCFLESCRSFKQARIYRIFVHGYIIDTELFKSQGSSVDVMMGYRLDGRGTGF
jgi:hypothetical protein